MSDLASEKALAISLFLGERIEANGFTLPHPECAQMIFWAIENEAPEAWERLFQHAAKAALNHGAK